MIQIALVSLFAVVVTRCSVYEDCPLPGLLEDGATTDAVGLQPDTDWNQLMKRLRNSNEGKSIARLMVSNLQIMDTLPMM